MTSYPSYPDSRSAPAASSSSQDPYAPFYYWDPAANNWAFDYESYYATYGYPVDYYSNNSASAGAGGVDSYANTDTGGYDISGYAHGGTDPYATGAAGPSPAAYDPSAAVAADSASASGSKEKPKYDEHGRIIPGRLKKGETRETVLRKAAGKVWEDQTLLEWDPSHKRLFVGDLGNDVTDEILAASFDKFASFSKARVVRKKDGKSKGYGFVAFADPEDFLKAWKQMDGKYIGSRPCRLKKAADVVNPVTIGARKDKMLAISAKYDSEAYKSKMGGVVGKNLRRPGAAKPYGR
ncbi:RNA-binding domain-containing protein [Testicularia cyperi]|uniref:RNA-binding domain-containing protein n=1 Tax=Testicularia cyperi TaxID=1882483 RepID=A0A317XY93_9BASI|nr:RNA-binding domain-containing protein [Testicularia cyperi]